jgi:5-keto 4-deoxyuronate isomerase
LKDFDRIVAEDFLITGSNGKTITKAEKRSNVAADYTESKPNSTSEPDSVFKIDETSHQVRVFKNTAISSGYIIEKYIYKGNKVDSRVYFTCTYLKRNNQWQVVAAHYSRIKQS